MTKVRISSNGQTSNAIPQAPRSMPFNQAPNLQSALDQIARDTAERMYPRIALYEALSGSKDRSKSRHPSANPDTESRRDFLDAFAYICDVEKGGKTVTATGLQQLPKSNILLLAANEGVRAEIYEYAIQILETLGSIAHSLPGQQQYVRRKIYKLVVEQCRPRIQFYKVKLQRFATICRMKLRTKDRNDVVRSLRKKLKTLSEPDADMTLETYIDICFEMRDSALKDLEVMNMQSDDDFAELSHYIWRGGATRAAVDTLIECMATNPALQRISTIRKIDAPGAVEKMIDPSSITPYEILYGISAESASFNPLQAEAAFNRLFILDPPQTRPLLNHMRSRTKIVTRVHAELQVADFFSRSVEAVFADNDKYIGTSKPACYFCYNWLVFHKQHFVPPATHQRIIPGCRGPDQDLNGNGAGVLIDMYAKISREVGQDIFRFLHKGSEPRRQHMSTEASSRAPSQL